MSLMIALVASGAASAQSVPLPTPARWVPGELVVRLDPDFAECAHCLMKARRGFARSTSRHTLDQVIRRFGIKEFEPVLGADHSSRHQVRSGRQRANSPALRALQQSYVVHMAADTDLHEAAQQLRRDPLVVRAEPNYLAEVTSEAAADPNTPSFMTPEVVDHLGFDDPFDALLLQQAQDPAPYCHQERPHFRVRRRPARRHETRWAMRLLDEHPLSDQGREVDVRVQRRA